MKENLIQTSSIFSKEKYQQPTEGELQQGEYVEEIEQLEEKSPLCQVIEMPDGSDKASLYTDTFFPDTYLAVLYNRHAQAYFAAHLKAELIFEVPIHDFTVELVTTEMVVLKVALDYNAPLDFKYMVIQNKDYYIEDSFEFSITGEETVSYMSNEYCIVSSEIKPSRKYDKDGLLVSEYYYEGHSFMVTGLGELVYKDDEKAYQLLLSGYQGSYLGFYLKLTSDDTVLLHGRTYQIVNRLTLTLLVVQDLETFEFKLLTCNKQMLLDPSTVFDGDVSQIRVANGVAMLIQDVGDSEILNVFTPNHQRIVLEPGYSIDLTSVENGLFFKKDNVLLLANGSLLFIEPVDKQNINVKGKGIRIPCEYLGDL